MTRKEAINTLKALKATLKIYPKRKKQKESVAQLTEAINMAISALQAEPSKSSICKTCANKDFCKETLRLYGLPNTRVDECKEHTSAEPSIPMFEESTEDIKKKQIEVGAVADGIVGYETIKKTAERYKTESSDLISRQWLLDLYGDYIGDNGEPKYHVPLEVVRQNIIDAPSADRPTLQLTEEAAIKLLQLIGWMQEHDKEIGRPRGTWEHWGSPFSEDDIINTMVCTNCGMRFVEIKGETFYYCPHCGARMTPYKGSDPE